MFYTFPYTNGDGFERYRTKVCSARVHHIEMDEKGNLWPVESETVGNCIKVFTRWINVPCGKCPGCRLDQSRVWANRLMCELPYHDEKECWFLTLTYDNENVPSSYFVDDESGEAKEVFTLRPDDVTKFIKDLRASVDYRYRGKRLRFYLSGEYGERTHRPHYHAIIFGLPLDSEKLVLWKTGSKGFSLYKCSELEEIWSRGNVLVSRVSWATCAYVARYVTKKLGQTSEVYEKLGIVPEFSRMSRRPGIGYQYLQDHPECIEQGIHLSLPDGGRNFTAPRYFKSFTFANECDILHSDVQEIQQDYQDSIFAVSNLEFCDFLDQQELAIFQSLTRSERSGV